MFLFFLFSWWRNEDMDQRRACRVTFTPPLRLREATRSRSRGRGRRRSPKESRNSCHRRSRSRRSRGRRSRLTIVDLAPGRNIQEGQAISPGLALQDTVTYSSAAWDALRIILALIWTQSYARLYAVAVVPRNNTSWLWVRFYSIYLLRNWLMLWRYE